MIINNELKVIKGGLSTDDRGEVSFVNDFKFKDVKRFYCVQNHKSGFIRAWHAHKKEAKYVSVISGSALIGAVKIDDWENPSKDNQTFRYILSSKQPSILYIPQGYANGFMSLNNDTILIFYSTTSLEESLDDDYRFDSRFWDIWNVIER